MSDKARAVVLGCGGISNAWLGTSTVREDVEVVALVDLRREAAERQAEKFDLSDALICTDMEEALQKTRPDVLFNLTTPEAHCPTTLTALQHGCHVLTEKPLADSMDNARRMVEAARAAGRTLAVSQNRRHHPHVRALRSFIAGGGLGQLTMVQSNFFLAPRWTGFRLHMPHVLLLDMAVHTIDACRCIAQADAQTVYCREWNPPGSYYDRDAAAVALFEMTDGLVYTYEGSWCADGHRTSWEAEWRIVGTKGTALWDGANPPRAEVVAREVDGKPEMAKVDVPVPDLAKTGHDAVIGDFVDCLRNGRTPETVATDNIKSLAMVFGAIGSAESGQRVPVTCE
jgi:predicted dehydrogenase